MTRYDTGVKSIAELSYTSMEAGAEQLALGASPAMRERAPFSLAFLTDAGRLAALGSSAEQIAQHLPAGTGVIFRDYDAPDRAEKADRLAKICRKRALIFCVAGDVALARRVGADGAHLPAHLAAQMPEKPAGLIVTVACHSPIELETAARLEADAAFLSPAFPTASHPQTEGLGAAAFLEMALKSTIPVLALGGVTQNNAALVACRTVVGFGAIGAFATAQPSTGKA